MATGSSFKTDIYEIFNYYQNTLIVHPKELFIETYRSVFKEDSFYHYVDDAWGFPNTPSHVNLPLGAGMYDDATTRLYIGEMYRGDVKYYPSIFIKSLGSKSVPISMSRNKGVVQWSNVVYTDGYGHETIISTPQYYAQGGCWEGSIEISVEARNPRARDEIVEIAAIIPTDLRFEDMQIAGVIVKPANISAPTEIDDRNDKIFKQSITFEIRTEWERRIPITTTADMIQICCDLGNLSVDPPVYAENMQISTNVELLDSLSNL